MGNEITDKIGSEGEESENNGNELVSKKEFIRSWKKKMQTNGEPSGEKMVVNLVERKLTTNRHEVGT